MDDLKIRQKTEEMIAYGYTAVRQFPKSERHVLAQEIRITMWSILRLIIVTNRRYHKKITMQDLDAELDLLRSQIRISMELKFLPFHQYEVWSRHVDEIGRMIGGWFKSIQSAS
jgi:four helix bundle protein